MLTREKMGGVYALVPTPYKADGTWDEEAFRENTRRLCEAGIHGIATTGTFGEFHTIPWEDHKRLIRALVDEAKGKVATVPGCSGVNTEEAIVKTRFAQDCAADAVMNVVPYYQTLTKAECIKYLKDLARACPEIGVVVYNNPSTAKVLLDAEVYREVAREPNLCGSKEVVSDFSHWMSIVRASNLAYMHVDHLFAPAMMWGGKGLFSIAVLMKPKLVMAAYEACKEGLWRDAMELQYKINELTSFSVSFFSGYTWISAYKAAVNAYGFINAGYPRSPFIPIPQDLQAKARTVLEERFGNLK